MNQLDIDEIEAVLPKFHEDPIQGGHTGIAKTLAKVKTLFLERYDSRYY